jgi:hypothetical protein
MLNLLTPYAEQAISTGQVAARTVGLAEVPAEYLLAGLLRHPDSHASLLLARLGISKADLAEVLPPSERSLPPAGRPQREPELGPAANRALLEASMHAGRTQDRRVGTVHLLIGLAADPDSPIGQVLNAAGATAAALSAAITQLRLEQERGLAPKPSGDQAQKRLPTGVIGAVTLMIMQLTSCVIFLPLVPSLYNYGAPSSHDWFGITGWFWTSLCCAFLIAPLLRGRRRAWAAVTGILFAKSTAFLGFTSFVAAELLKKLTRIHQLDLMAFGLIVSFATVLLLVTCGLFRDRLWFGVPPREGWRTMLRQGWWALTVTAFLDLGFTAASALRW